MEVGVGVWYKDKSDGWCPATISKRDDSAGLIKFCLEVRKGKIKEDVTVNVNKDSEPDSLKLMNSAEDSEVENLINLPFLHEPAILYCLELRYGRSEIYTYTGPILIAMNPFKKVDLYSDKLLDTYFKYGIRKAQGMVEDPLPPHIFAIADSAYRFMMNAILSDFNGDSTSDQSILISGESGAGKTESTKIVLRYLTTVASDAKEIKVEGSIMDKVLKSNPILEALGNAKTIRNDNSSRFGKFIELKFNDKGHLIGGFIRTYLLEKVRLTSQQLNERNFHIFYQMGVGGNFFEKERWGLKSLRDFDYVNQGQCFGIERINDEEDFSDLRNALKTLRFDEDDVHNMFDIIAGLLHLGQLKFEAVQGIGEDSSELSKDTAVATSLSSAMKLLGINGGDFLKTVTERTIVARTDKYQKKLTVIQASDARDSISRIVYGKLFDWVVSNINKEIKTAGASAIRSEIAVLDIFGFECLTENSFEQLCINYTNETLQQQFNQFIFKLEQAEYEEEGIEWSFIEFPDNQDCIDLIESKKKSIFRVLDEECMTAAGTDTKFHGRLMLELGEFTRLSVPDKLKVLHKFSINHYAGEVVYSTKTFVDKNKDELPKESIDLMAVSSLPLLKLIFTTNFGSEVSEMPTQKGNALTSPTICTQFKGQLGSLMSKINATKPHYIRCLKPNDQNKPDLLNRVRTTEQLRYGGVLEAVRVARSGFPVRLSHEEFYGRYRPIANPFSPAAAKLPRYAKGSQMEQAKLCTSLLDFIRDESLPKLSGNEKNFAKLSRKLKELSVMYSGSTANNMDLSTSIQLGKTKVFFRKPAHDLFESRKSKHTNITVRRLQAQIRKWLARVRYLRALKAVYRLQLAFRYFLFHCRFIKKRRNNAATVIQTKFRGHFHFTRFKKMSSAVLACQRLYRGNVGRKIACMLRIERADELAEAASELGRQRAAAERVAKEARIQKETEEKAEMEARLLKQQQEKEETEARLLKEEDYRAELARSQRKKEEEEAAMKMEIEKKLKALEDAVKLREDEAAAAAACAAIEVSELKNIIDCLNKEIEHHVNKEEELVSQQLSLAAELQVEHERVNHIEAVLFLVQQELKDEKNTVQNEKNRYLNLQEEFSLLETQIRVAEAAAISERESSIARERMDQFEAEKAALDNKIRELEAINAASLLKLSKMETENTDVIRVQSDKIHELEAALEIKSIELSEFSSSFETVETKLKEELLSLDEKCLNFEKKLDLKVDALGILQREVEELRLQKDDAEMKSNEKDDAIQALHDMVRNLELACSDQDKKIRSLEAATSIVRSLSEEKSEALSMNKLLSDQVLGNKQEIEKLLESLKEAETNLVTVKREKAELQDAYDDLESKVQELDVQNKKKDETLSSTVKYLHMHTFNSRSENFKNKLSEGIEVKVFSVGSPIIDCMLTFSKNPLLLFFAQMSAVSTGAFRFFSAKNGKNNMLINAAAVPSISLVDITEISIGLTKEASLLFANEPGINEFTLTICYKPSMLIALVFRSEDIRNTVLNGIKVLISEVQLELDNHVTAVAANITNSNTESITAPEDIHEKYARLMTQVLALTNDVMDREEQLIMMRNRAKIHEKEDLIRAELTRRLGELLIQKEDLIESMRGSE